MGRAGGEGGESWDSGLENCNWPRICTSYLATSCDFVLHIDYNFSIKSRDKFKSWYIPERVVNSGTSLYVTMTFTLRTTSFPGSSLLLPRESRERTLGTRLLCAMLWPRYFASAGAQMVVVRVVGSWPRSIVSEMKSNHGNTPGSSSWKHHRNQLTVKAWQEAVKKKTIDNTTPTC